jgi:hypothetical protein
VRAHRRCLHDQPTAEAVTQPEPPTLAAAEGLRGKIAKPELLARYGEPVRS